MGMALQGVIALWMCRALLNSGKVAGPIFRIPGMRQQVEDDDVVDAMHNFNANGLDENVHEGDDMESHEEGMELVPYPEGEYA